MPPTNTNTNTNTGKGKTLDRLKSLISASSCGGCGSRRLKLQDVHHPLPKHPESDPQPSRDPDPAAGHSNSRLAETFAVVKESDDPYLDFKHSMLQMIFEKEMFGKGDLEELLACFLRLNSPCHHHSIIRAFSEIWKAVMPDLDEPPKCQVLLDQTR